MEGWVMIYATISRHALKGQKLLAQGNTLGIDNIEMVITPCKGKSFHTAATFLKLLPLQGVGLYFINTQGVALG